MTFVYVFANIAYVTAMSPQELLASNAVAVVSKLYSSYHHKPKHQADATRFSQMERFDLFIYLYMHQWLMLAFIVLLYAGDSLTYLHKYQFLKLFWLILGMMPGNIQIYGYIRLQNLLHSVAMPFMNPQWNTDYTDNACIQPMSCIPLLVSLFLTTLLLSPRRLVRSCWEWCHGSCPSLWRCPHLGGSTAPFSHPLGQSLPPSIHRFNQPSMICSYMKLKDFYFGLNLKFSIK